jgi:hypothetical protein
MMVLTVIYIHLPLLLWIYTFRFTIVQLKCNCIKITRPVIFICSIYAYACFVIFVTGESTCIGVRNIRLYKLTVAYEVKNFLVILPEIIISRISPVFYKVFFSHLRPSIPSGLIFRATNV